MPAASDEARIESFAKNPESGGIPASASPPISIAHHVFGISFRRPPILRMSCSPASAWMTMPAPRKRSALKNACTISRNIAFA